MKNEIYFAIRSKKTGNILKIEMKTEILENGINEFYDEKMTYFELHDREEGEEFKFNEIEVFNEIMGLMEYVNGTKEIPYCSLKEEDLEMVRITKEIMEFNRFYYPYCGRYKK